MKQLLSTYRYFQILSLDVVLGACAFSKLVAMSLNVQLTWQTYLCLALATWIVYTLDHLVDSLQLKENAITARHKFHFLHQRVLIGLVYLAGCIGLFLAFSLDHNIIIGGCIAGAISILHLIIVRFWGAKLSLFYQKEISVSFVFTLGVFSGPVSLLEGSIFNLEVVILFVLFYSIIYWNVVLFSWYEIEIDKQQDQASLSRFLGKNTIRTLFVSLFLISITILLASIILFDANGFQNTYVQLCWGGVILFYLSMSVFKNWFVKNDRYRILGDAMLCFPSILWFL